MKISVLGAGRWASCIALCLDRKNYDVLMWERASNKENPLFTTHANSYVTLSDRVRFTHDLSKAINFADIIIISILSQQVDNFMQSVKMVDGYQDKKIVLAMKGVEASTGRRLSEILIDNGVNKNNIAVWVGPGHVQSISVGQPTNMVISAYNKLLARELVDLFTNPKVLDFTCSNDIIGVELGAAAKNVIGIAAGILEGGKLEQKKGPLMVASLKEIGKFIDALGGDPHTAESLAFLGDFQATLFDHNSKNLTYGKAIMENGTTDEEVINKTVPVSSVEGIMTAKALLKRMIEFNNKVTDDKQLHMPITESVNDITSGKIKIEEVGSKYVAQYMSEKITEALNL